MKILNLLTSTPVAFRHATLIASCAIGGLVACQAPSPSPEVVRISLNPQSTALPPVETDAAPSAPSHASSWAVERVSLSSPPVVEPVATPQQARVRVVLPPINSTTPPALHRLIESALLFNQQHSPLPLTVLQRQAESDAIMRSHWPTVQPTARWDRNGKPYAGVDAAYTLLDFGVSSQREKQGELAIHLSQLDFSLEQRNIAADVIIELARIFALKEKSRLVQEALVGLNQLSHYAAIRVQAGFINESEPLLLNLRIAELHAEKDAMTAEIALKTQLLSAKLVTPITSAEVPSFHEMSTSLLPIVHTGALQRQRAELNAQLAQSKLKQTERSRLPQLAVEGGIGIGLTHGSSKQHNIGLVLKSPTSLFTGGANVKAAEAEFRAAQQQVKQIQLHLDTELARIQLERKRLNDNRHTLLQLEKEGKQALTLFKSQFEAATATISDGLNAHRTLLQTRQQLVELDAELLVLIASEIRISDGAFLTK